MKETASISARGWNVNGIRKLVGAWFVGWEVFKKQAGDRLECATNEIVAACPEDLELDDLREIIKAALVTGYALADQDRTDEERNTVEDWEGGEEE